MFRASALGTCTFELVVNKGSYSSFADTVQVTLKNDPPIADAGDDQIYSNLQPIAAITLDGSRSFDPEHVALRYRWTQITGWTVQLNHPHASKPTFMRPWQGTYVFQLVVNDGLQDSKPIEVTVYIGPIHAPVADAGPSRYAAAEKALRSMAHVPTSRMVLGL